MVATCLLRYSQTGCVLRVQFFIRRKIPTNNVFCLVTTLDWFKIGFEINRSTFKKTERRDTSRVLNEKLFYFEKKKTLI